MNLAVLKKSRRRPMPGDLFVLQPTPGTYLFGRVIRTDANAGGFPNAKLIYIYRTNSRGRRSIPTLRSNELLLPPMMTNNLPWSRGYFEFLCHRPLLPEDVLRRHVFLGDHGRFYDETGREVRRSSGYVGDWALHSFRTIDDAVSKALGIPLSPG